MPDTITSTVGHVFSARPETVLTITLGPEIIDSLEYEPTGPIIIGAYGSETSQGGLWTVFGRYPSPGLAPTVTTDPPSGPREGRVNLVLLGHYFWMIELSGVTRRLVVSASGSSFGGSLTI